MACQRDCVTELIKQVEAWGVQVNISKTKARGNKGIFCYKDGINRIDISRNIDDAAILPTFLHELAHFIHYKYDNGNFRICLWMIISLNLWNLFLER